MNVAFSNLHGVLSISRNNTATNLNTKFGLVYINKLDDGNEYILVDEVVRRTISTNSTLEYGSIRNKAPSNL